VIRVPCRPCRSAAVRLDLWEQVWENWAYETAFGNRGEGCDAAR
jgi:hypothetical protein